MTQTDLNLNSGLFCRNSIASRSKFNALVDRKCHKLKGHPDDCKEFSFLDHLLSNYPRIGAKVIRDSIMTTGAAWKSEEAGPNRILRWVMLLSDEELLSYNINMSKLKPQVVRKLRDKAADYDSCIRVAMWLTYIAYGMPDAPRPPKEIQEYFEKIFGAIPKDSTTCCVCLLPLSFLLFNEARRGKAAIETCHKDPRSHSPENVGFSHRECNIAQGDKTLEEFYDWIAGIVSRARK